MRFKEWLVKQKKRLTEAVLGVSLDNWSERTATLNIEAIIKMYNTGQLTKDKAIKELTELGFSLDYARNLLELSKII